MFSEAVCGSWRPPTFLAGKFVVVTTAFHLLGCNSCIDEQRSERPDIEIPDLLKMTLRVHQTLGDGEDPDLGIPRHIQTDSRGNIYLSDQARMQVLVWTSDGQFIRSIGERGSEEGQLRGITSMVINDMDQLIIFDSTNERVTTFDDDGRIIRIAPFDKSHMGPISHCVGSDLLMLRVPSRGENGHLFHIYESIEWRKLNEFGSVDRFPIYQLLPLRTAARAQPGSLWIRGNAEIFYSPLIYSGRIYKYQKENGRWQFNDALFGYVERTPSFEKFTRGTQPDPTSTWFSVRSISDTYSAIVHNESRGLFSLANGDLVNFTIIRIGNYRVFGAEVFTDKGRLRGFAPLHAILAEEENRSTFALLPKWKDDQDLLYLIDLREYPRIIRIVVVRIEIADHSDTWKSLDLSKVRFNLGYDRPREGAESEGAEIQQTRHVTGLL